MNSTFEQTALFIKETFKCFEQEGIEYCVLRKVEDVVRGEAHDIDMVINSSQLHIAHQHMLRIGKELGWRVFAQSDKDRGYLRTVHFYNIYEQNISIIHFDIFNSFSWNGLPIISNFELLKGRIIKYEVYCASIAVETATKLFSRLLFHGYIKEEYKEFIQNATLCNEKEIRNCYELFINNEFILDKIINLSQEENWSEIESLTCQIRESVFEGCSFGFVKKVINKVKNLSFQLRRYTRSSGIMIAFLGTDGSGKSTIIDNIPKVLGNTFNEDQIQYYHWRPKYLKSPKRNSEMNDNFLNPHQKKPYGKFISFGKFMYFNLDYILGYWFDVKLQKGRNKLVIFDRYYYDYLVDKYRYRLNISDWVLILFKGLIPRPDITFILTGDPQMIYDRKKELPPEELKIQMNRLNKLIKTVSNAYEIDVNKSLDNVIFDVCKAIIMNMEKQCK